MTLLSADEILRIGYILMAAANADGRFEREEAAAIYSILTELLHERELPDQLRWQLEAFEPREFDLQRACAKLDLKTPERRRFLLQLVARVSEVDNIHDLQESDFIVQVARCTGASPKEYRDLIVEILSEEPDRPPPLPKEP